MYNITEWLNQAIRATGGFILWMILLMLAAGIVMLVVIVIYAVIKAAVDNAKEGKKKDE